MAILGICQSEGIIGDPQNNNRIVMAARIVVLGNQLGDLTERVYFETFSGLRADTLSNLEADLRAAIRASMEGHGITFNGPDNVLIR